MPGLLLVVEVVLMHRPWLLASIGFARRVTAGIAAVQALAGSVPFVAARSLAVGAARAAVLADVVLETMLASRVLPSLAALLARRVPVLEAVVLTLQQSVVLDGVQRPLRPLAETARGVLALEA